ncbi:hypothetical protein F3J29_11880 [Enterobacter sp. Cy-643]|nr:hypothetical protein [Enterobacter sp. Cy-643]
MPAEFRQYLFNVPLSARVALDGKILGDAIVILSENGQVQLIRFTDNTESEYGEGERQHWLTALANPVPLGECKKGCPAGLMAIDYNISDARLTLLTPHTTTNNDRYWYTLPEEGDTGLMFSNQLNLSGSRQQSALSWNAGIDAALGNWSVTSKFQQDSSWTNGQDSASRHAMTSLYTQREFQQHFLRAGLFTPDSQGLLRQPYLASGGISTLAGIMAGSGDALLKSSGTPALYPVYITANREGIAEIYRDGSLISSQPVMPGLQELDTSLLPQGIYDVEIRVLEDGRETSRVTETINKPGQWRTPGQRLRYNFFAGKQQTLFNSDSTEQESDLAVGSSINYLLTPRITTGFALQKVGSENQTGASFDWQIAPAFQLYSNVWRSNVTGYGFDSQGIWTHKQGMLAMSHSRSWYRQDNDLYSRRPLIDHNTSFSATWRLNSENSLNGRLTHSSRYGGIGIDIGFNTRATLAGTAINWRISGFDRPYGNNGNLRNQGFSLNASFALGADGRSGNLSVGSRTDNNGARDLYATASVNQQWSEENPIKTTNLTLTGDRHGAGFSAYNQFDTDVAQGTLWGQSSTLNGNLSGGINMGTLLAFGQGKVALSNQANGGQKGGMIVNVDSDDDTASLVALTPSGNVSLKPGRNFIPLEAWKPGTVQIDFTGTDAPALKVEPEYLDYQHIPGGISARDVRVMKTITLMGRLVNAGGKPLGGAFVVNHAGRTVTQPDGLFTLEIHELNPVLTVKHASISACEIKFSPAEQKNDDIIFAGNLTCPDTEFMANHHQDKKDGV